MYKLLILLLLIFIFYYTYNTKSKTSEILSIYPNSEKLSNNSYIKLYDDFDYSNLVYETSESVKYMVRATVRSIDINIPSSETSDKFIELWNVRPDNVLASSVSDFYENTIYTTPARLRDVTGNLELIARIKAGEHIKTNNLPIIKKIFIVSNL